MGLRGKAAIVGFGELPSVRSSPGKTSSEMLAEASRIAIRDAGLRKEDIDGLITFGVGEANAHHLPEYMGLNLAFSEGVTTHGASGAYSIALAAAMVDAGIVNHMLCTFGGTTDSQLGGMPKTTERIAVQPGHVGEWEAPFGPVVAMNGAYGLMKQRHMFQYGTTDRQFAKIAVNQRFNALTNPNAAFKGQPITVEDVLNSRYTNEPLHILESVMPCAYGGAVIVTSAERAKLLPNPPAYVLGFSGSAATHDFGWQHPGDITITPVVRTAPQAYRMSGYAAKDMQFAEMYD